MPAQLLKRLAILRRDAIHKRSRRAGEIVALELDLVRKQDDLLTAVEVYGEQLAAEVLALRDQRTRRCTLHDSTREHDRTR